MAQLKTYRALIDIPLFPAMTSKIKRVIFIPAIGLDMNRDVQRFDVLCGVCESNHDARCHVRGHVTEQHNAVSGMFSGILPLLVEHLNIIVMLPVQLKSNRILSKPAVRQHSN